MRKGIGFSGSPRKGANTDRLVQQVLGFLGFTPKEILMAAGTHAPGDVEKQTELMAKAKTVGAGLA